MLSDGNFSMDSFSRKITVTHLSELISHVHEFDTEIESRALQEGSIENAREVKMKRVL